jgi:hypothetical protein
MGSIPTGGYLEAEILLAVVAEGKREGIAHLPALSTSEPYRKAVNRCVMLCSFFPLLPYAARLKPKQ